ncbi:MAG: hypothetical protein P4L51_20045 [Puia sp.]|nr:hypothetical protein [Puia sp.]
MRERLGETKDYGKHSENLGLSRVERPWDSRTYNQEREIGNVISYSNVRRKAATLSEMYRRNQLEFHRRKGFTYQRDLELTILSGENGGYRAAVAENQGKFPRTNGPFTFYADHADK